MKAPSMRARLLAAFALVAVVGGVVFAVLVRTLVPSLFDGTMGRLGRGPAGSGMGNGGAGGAGGATSASSATDTRDAVVSSVNTAMFVSLAASLLVATVLAIWLSRRTLRHLDQVRAGTRALSAGNYRTQVAVPPEPELAALVTDINQLAAELANTEQRRAALIGDVAHELRTPLSSIAGHLEGFQDGLFSREETVSAVDKEVRRLRRLTDDLAAVSRADEGALALHTRTVDLGALVGDVARRQRPAFESKGVALEVHVADAAPADIDPDRVEQVVTNLLANALTYTPAGGEVGVTLGHNAHMATVRVADTGRGLDAEELLRVFDRFYRAEPNDRTGGTGVGLTIARSIARAHGGDVTANSPGRGGGATFELSLPLARTA